MHHLHVHQKDIIDRYGRKKKKKTDFQLTTVMCLLFDAAVTRRFNFDLGFKRLGFSVRAQYRRLSEGLIGSRNTWIELPGTVMSRDGAPHA